MPHETVRLIDHDPRRGSRCVAVLGAGERRERFVEAFAELHPEFGAMPVVLHLVDAVPFEAADGAAARLAAGSRLMLHPTGVTSIEDQPNGTQGIGMADGTHMTVDVVVDAGPAAQPVPRPHPHRFAIGAVGSEPGVARAVLEVLRTRNDAAVCLADIGPDVAVFDGVVLV